MDGRTFVINVANVGLNNKLITNKKKIRNMELYKVTTKHDGYLPKGTVLRGDRSLDFSCYDTVKETAEHHYDSWVRVYDEEETDPVTLAQIFAKIAVKEQRDRERGEEHVRREAARHGGGSNKLLDNHSLWKNY